MVLFLYVLGMVNVGVAEWFYFCASLGGRMVRMSDDGDTNYHAMAGLLLLVLVCCGLFVLVGGQEN